MELYLKTCFDLSKKLTNNYSTSFSMSSRLFSGDIRKYIYAIYAMVRVADEIVDTFEAGKSQLRLTRFKAEVYKAMKSRYSSNPVLHAFANTAEKFNITGQLIDPFFDSMMVDVNKKTFSQNEYQEYIYGSAEVVGLMCLKVFVAGDEKKYKELEQGASSLGAAYQKVNFLRDLKADYEELGRVYFPGVSFDNFDDKKKQSIIKDIKKDFLVAKEYLDALPDNSKLAVRTSYNYYHALLNKLDKASASDIKHARIRVPNWKKLYLLLKSRVVK